MTLPSIAPFLPLCNVQASAVIEATSLNATTGVQCAAVDPATGNVYIGGTFQKVNGVTRQGLACINRSGVLQSWNPGVSGSTYAASGVYAMVWVPGTGLYISGSFTGVGGGTGTTAQTGVALLNSAGAVLTWYPTAGFNYGSILCVDGSGNVYTGGGYGLSQISSSGVVSAWNTGMGAFFSSAMDMGRTPTRLVNHEESATSSRLLAFRWPLAASLSGTSDAHPAG